MTISLKAARSLIVGDVSLLGDALTTQGDTNTYEITDFNSFSVYRVAATVGTATISGSTITLVMPSTTTATQLTLSVFKDDRPNYFVIAIGAESIAQPVITSPSNNATQVSLTPTIQVNGFATVPAGQDTHVSTNWQVSADANFTNLKVNNMGDTVNKTTYAVPSGALSINADYYIRVQFTGAAMGTSAWSQVTKITTRSQYISTPTVTVEGAPTTVGESPKLTASSFVVLGGGTDSHATTDWQILNADTQAVVWQSLGNSVNKLSINVPSGLLQVSTNYKARVRFSGSALGTSGWGEATFQTVPQFAYGKYLAKNVTSGGTSTVFGIDVSTPVALLNSGVAGAQSFSPDGKHYAICNNSNSGIQFYRRSGDTFVFLSTVEQTQGTWISCTYSRDSKYFYATCLGGNNEGTRTVKYTVEGDTYVKQANLTLTGTTPSGSNGGQVYRDMTFSADGGTFVTMVTYAQALGQQAYGTLMAWDHLNGAFTNPRVFEAANQSAVNNYSRVVAHPTQNLFAFRTQTNTLYVVKVSSGSITQQLKLESTNAGEIQFDATGQWMIFGTIGVVSGGVYFGNYQLYKYNGVDNWSLNAVLRDNQNYPVLCKITPDNMLFLSNGFNWTVNNFNPITGAVTQLNEIAGTQFSGGEGSPDSRVWPSVS